GHDTEPWPYRAVLVEARGHDVDTELQRAGLIKERRSHTGSASVVNVHRHPPGVRQVHDLLELVCGHDLVRHCQPGHDYQRYTGLTLQRRRELVDPGRVDQRGAGLRHGAHDRRVTVACRYPKDHVPRLDQCEMGRIRGTCEPVEKGHVVLLRRASKVLQGGLLELVEVQGRGHKVIGNGQFVRAEWQPVFQPREVIERLWATGPDTRRNMPPGLLK